jgi:peptidoglycan-associated lipoprotein
MIVSVNSSTVFRLALVGLCAASLAACAKKPKMATQVPSAPPASQTQPSIPLPPDRGPSTPPVNTTALPGSAQDFIVNVGDRVYFDTDSYDIRSDAQPLLDAQSGWLRRYGAVQVRIEGNADERGTREYNLALGSRRANSIKEFLTSHGVSADRIETISYGKEMPIDPGNTEEAYAKNRNGHTAIVSGAR